MKIEIDIKRVEQRIAMMDRRIAMFTSRKNKINEHLAMLVDKKKKADNPK